MAKVSLFKPSEISVSEEMKGKQIAVKENNITSLNDFYQTNLKVESPIVEEQITNVEESKDNAFAFMNNLEENAVNNSILENEETVSIMDNTEEVIENAPVVNLDTTNLDETPVIDITIPANEPDVVDDGTNNAPIINLIPDEQIVETEEEMDPELKEIQERLNQVIADLDQYKKKIKKLEIEINENLEKSREVLKDTQAAAKIMSIQQERQKSISEEATGDSVLEDPTRILNIVA